MSIRLDTDKCWVTNPEDLKIKRYLSDTRSYFREGAWIRTPFNVFFPDIKIDPQSGLYYDFNTLVPACTAQKGEDLSVTQLPAELVQQFQSMLQDYNTDLKNRSISFNEEVSSKEFTLPDPDLHPELYWLIKTEEDYRLIILWGLESEKKYANLTLQEVAKSLEEKHVGKIVLKHKLGVIPAQVEQNIPPLPAVASIPETVQSIESKTNTTQPELEKKSKVELEKALPEKKSEKTAATPKPKTEPLQKIKPKKEAKPKAVAATKTPRKPVKPISELMPKRTRGILLKMLATSALVMILIYMAAGISYLYLGRDIRIESSSAASKGLSFQLPKQHEALLPDGSKVAASVSDRILSIPAFIKSGDYKITLLQPESNKVFDTIQHQYQRLRNDFYEGPVATLLVSTYVSQRSEPVSAYVGASFHEASQKPIELQISWGDGDAPFETIAPTQALVSHLYSEPGIYKVILVAKDAEGNWDYDMTELTVLDSFPTEPFRSVNLPPVVDAEIVSIRSVEGTQEVTLDISNSFDPDGEIQSLEINWDDGSNAQAVAFPTAYISHRYKGLRRANIHIVAKDDKGLENKKPSMLLVDFQAKQLSNPELYASISDDNKFSKVFIPDHDPEGLRLVRKEFDQLHRNKQHILFELLNPVSLTQNPLTDVKWTLKGPNNTQSIIEGTTCIETFLVDGTYTLSVSATALDGIPLETEHRIAVSISKKTTPICRAANWLSHRFFPKTMSATL